MVLGHTSTRLTLTQVCQCSSAFLEPHAGLELLSLVIELNHKNFTESAATMMRSPLFAWDLPVDLFRMWIRTRPLGFSPRRCVVACVVHQDFSHSRRSRTTLCTDSVSSRSVRSCCVGSWCFAGWFAAFLSGWPRAFSCSSLSKVRFLSRSFAPRLEARSSLLLQVTGRTYCSLEHWLIFMSKK